MTESSEVIVDSKEMASRTFADVVARTRDNFPDERFRPSNVAYGHYGIKTKDFPVFGNSDGVGTKIEFIERLFSRTKNYALWKSPSSDAIAMAADDGSRDGKFIIGIVNSVDVNNADDPEYMAALAAGMEEACNKGRFPLLNGETAELGYRTAGWGSHRLNWNVEAKTLINPDKLIDGSKLRAGQPIVALREHTVRSNGFTRVRAILENAYIQLHVGVQNRHDAIAQIIRDRITRVGAPVSLEDILSVLKVAASDGSDITEQIQLPWHEVFPELSSKLAAPSTIYTPLIYEAQGGVDGPLNIPLMGNAHISGGGVPLKGKRMVEKFGLGMNLDAVFPNPEGVDELYELAQKYPHPTKGALVDKRNMYEQWNGGVGFLSVTENRGHADEFVALAAEMGYEAAIAGEITNQRAIEWRGEKWTY